VLNNKIRIRKNIIVSGFQGFRVGIEIGWMDGWMDGWNY